MVTIGRSVDTLWVGTAEPARWGPRHVECVECPGRESCWHVSRRRAERSSRARRLERALGEEVGHAREKDDEEDDPELGPADEVRVGARMLGVIHGRMT